MDRAIPDFASLNPGYDCGGLALKDHVQFRTAGVSTGSPVPRHAT
jgi:hypothetical protein